MLSSSFTRISGHRDFKVNVFMFPLFLRNKIKNKKMLPDCGKITHGPDALFFLCVFVAACGPLVPRRAVFSGGPFLLLILY